MGCGTSGFCNERNEQVKLWHTAMALLRYTTWHESESVTTVSGKAVARLWMAFRQFPVCLDPDEVYSDWGKGYLNHWHNTGRRVGCTTPRQTWHVIQFDNAIQICLVLHSLLCVTFYIQRHIWFTFNFGIYSRILVHRFAALKLRLRLRRQSWWSV